MATKYLKVCDGCEKTETMDQGPFGANMLPEGWVKAAEWGKDGSPDEVVACSWACMSKAAKAAAHA